MNGRDKKSDGRQIEHNSLTQNDGAASPKLGRALPIYRKIKENNIIVSSRTAVRHSLLLKRFRFLFLSPTAGADNSVINSPSGYDFANKRLLY
jgi:hypothetical protein